MLYDRIAKQSGTRTVRPSTIANIPKIIMANDVILNRICVTKNYSLFSPSRVNRSIYPAHVKTLETSMAELGFLKSQPISVKRAGNTLTIVDGHHRYEAAKNLGIELYFVAYDDLPETLIPIINAKQKKWMPKDFLDYYAEKLQLPAYQELKMFVSEYKISLSVVIALALGFKGTKSDYGGYNEQHRQTFENGEFTFVESNHVYKIASWTNDFAKYFDGAKDRRFVLALNILSGIDGYSHETMMQKVSYQSGKLVRQASTEYYLTMLEDIYNYRMRGERMRFSA